MRSWHTDWAVFPKQKEVDGWARFYVATIGAVQGEPSSNSEVTFGPSEESPLGWNDNKRIRFPGRGKVVAKFCAT